MEENYTLDKLFSNKMKSFESQEISSIQDYTKDIERLNTIIKESVSEEEIIDCKIEISNIEKKIKQKKKR